MEQNLNDKPLSNMQIARYIESLRKEMNFDDEVYGLVKSDLEDGLTQEQTEKYLDKNFNIGQMRVLSEGLHKGIPEELFNILHNNKLSGNQMKVSLEFYEKGVPVETIQEAVARGEKPVVMRRLYEEVLAQLSKAAEQYTQDSEYVKELIAQMEMVVEKINYQEERYDALNKKLSDVEVLKEDKEVTERLVKENEDKDGIISHQQDELNKASSTIARLRDSIEHKDKEMERMRDRIESLEDKIMSAASDDQKVAEKEEKAGPSEVLAATDNKETVKTLADSQAVPPMYNGIPVYYQIPVTDSAGRVIQHLPVERTERKSNGGIAALFINLLEMDKSDCYNPFSYIREETDVVKLITNLISNTTPKGSTPSDPFWEKAEGLFLQAIFYYVWLEVQPAKRNFETVLKLLGEAEVKEPGKASKLDVRMKFLEESSPLGANHPAVKQYNKCMRGAGDTVRSIIISANSRLAFLENKQVLRLLSKDELNLSDIGIGVNGDGETKTALFCVIPDSDKSYNFIIGMLYTQIFQELYYQADFNCGGRLPIHVTFMLDEFANVALPDDFCSLLSTMRSREISSIIIIQNFAQLKALFKDTWETIPGNCDTFIYLGGNEQSTHKYVSELLGKGTIDKKSSGETKGRQGSSSRNYDVLGRELFTPDEVRKLDNKKCIIFIRGFDPIMDNKYIPFRHPMFNQTADGKGKAYVHKTQGADRIIGPPFEILSEKAIKHYEKMKDKGENVYIDTLTYEQFMLLGDKELSRRFSMQDEAEQKAKIDREQANEFEYADESQKAENSDSTNGGEKPVRNPEREKPKWEDTITNRMMHWSYTAEQKEEVKKALAAGVPKATILTYFYPEVTVEKMSSYRKEQ